MSSSRRAVHCAKCNRFLFNVVIADDSVLAVGVMAEIQGVRCQCKVKNNIWLGIADKDVRSDAVRVEEKLREKLEEGKS